MDSPQQCVPRVEAQEEQNQKEFDQTTGSTTPPPPSQKFPYQTTKLARQSTIQQTAACCRQLQETPQQVHLPTQPSAFTTRSWVIAAMAAPPASQTHTQSCLMQTTKSSKNKQRLTHAVQATPVKNVQMGSVINT